MIDWHNHILPGMDDGSRNVAESIEMIGAQAAQGVSTVIATPHFYADDESVESFLNRRNESFEKLKNQLPDNSVEILLGAEVRYYPGISQMAGLDSLGIDGGKLLLLEMPIASWTEYIVRELIEMSCRSNIQIILAHVERYRGLQKPAVWERIYESGILMQVNASFFNSFASRHKAISLLRDGRVHFIGSDCHNMTSRPPQIGRAFEIIRKKLGADYIDQMNEYGNSMLRQAVTIN